MRRLERQRNGGKPDPIKIENALRKIAKTWSNFLAFTILMGCAQKQIFGDYNELFYISHLFDKTGCKGIDEIISKFSE